MDSSTYVPDQQQVIQFTDPSASADDQTVTYNSAVFQTMKATSDKIGGVQWLIGVYIVLKSPYKSRTDNLASQASVCAMRTTRIHRCSRQTP